jgi:hypothetical protein
MAVPIVRSGFCRVPNASGFSVVYLTLACFRLRFFPSPLRGAFDSSSASLNFERGETRYATFSSGANREKSFFSAKSFLF